MKGLRKVAAAMFMVAASAATAGAAGICSDCFTFSGMVGGYSFDGEQHLETAPVVGIRGGYNFTRFFGVEALFDYIRTDGTKGQGDANAYRYGGDLLLHLLPDQRVVPYLAAGYGAISIDQDNHRTFTNGMFDYGLGVKVFLTDTMALRGDFRHLVFRDVNTQYNYEYTVGLAWQFGGGAATTAATGETQVPPSEIVAGAKPHAAPAVPPPTAQAPGPAAPAQKTAPPVEPARYQYCVKLHTEDDIDRAVIRPEYKEEMAEIGNFMKEYPTTNAVVEGYADNVGSPEHNNELSLRRAQSAVNYLVDNFGIDRSRFTAKGFGSSHPIADNGTDEGRQKNRRVEGVIDCASVAKEIKPPEKVCTGMQIEFDSGSAKIRSRYQKEIAGVAEFLKKYPSTNAIIEGHTDNVGGSGHNMKLSRQRAEAVVKYLVEKFGIERSRLTAKGYGSTRRIAYDSTAEGRQKNRRVDAVVDCVVKP